MPCGGSGGASGSGRSSGFGGPCCSGGRVGDCCLFGCSVACAWCGRCCGAIPSFGIAAVGIGAGAAVLARVAASPCASLVFGCPRGRGILALLAASNFDTIDACSISGFFLGFFTFHSGVRHPSLFHGFLFLYSCPFQYFLFSNSSGRGRGGGRLRSTDAFGFGFWACSGGQDTVPRIGVALWGSGTTVQDWVRDRNFRSCIDGKRRFDGLGGCSRGGWDVGSVVAPHCW